MFNCSLHVRACTMLPQPAGILTYLITTDLLTIKGSGLIRKFSFDTSTIPDGIEESNTQESESPITTLKLYRPAERKAM